MKNSKVCLDPFIKGQSLYFISCIWYFTCLFLYSCCQRSPSWLRSSKGKGAGPGAYFQSVGGKRVFDAVSCDVISMMHEVSMILHASMYLWYFGSFMHQSRSNVAIITSHAWFDTTLMCRNSHTMEVSTHCVQCMRRKCTNGSMWIETQHLSIDWRTKWLLLQVTWM